MDIQNIVNQSLSEDETSLEGYLIVNSSRPAPFKLVCDAVAELDPVIHIQFDVWACGAGEGGENCNRLFEEGFDFSNEDFLTRLLGRPYTTEDVFRRQSARMNLNLIQIPRTQARGGAVIIWRTFDHTLNARNGFFRIVKRSQGMDETTAKMAETVDIELKENQALILDGNLWIEYPMNGGGLGQYRIIKKG